MGSAMAARKLPRFSQAEFEEIGKAHLLLEPVIQTLQGASWGPAAVMLRNVAMVDMLLCRLYNKLEAAVLRAQAAQPTESPSEPLSESRLAVDANQAAKAAPGEEGR